MLRRFKLLALIGTGLAGLYIVAFVTVSLASREQLLGFDQPKRFCGFYLDCHRMVEVAGVETVPMLGEGAAARAARGVFHVVTVRYRSDAVRATMHMGPMAARVRDAAGTWYARDPDAEALVEGPAGLVNVPLESGAAFTTRLVFDLPAGVVAPQLYIRESHPFHRLTELFLIGDEDSFLHARTFFALTPEGAARADALTPDTVELVRVETDTAAGRAPDRVPADGVFYVVTLRVPPAAPLRATVVDAEGRRFSRALDVERLLARQDPVEANGVRRLVFDLPDRAPAPTLELSTPGWRGRLFGPRIGVALGAASRGPRYSTTIRRSTSL